MHFLHYLRENTAKTRENKRKLTSETCCSADFRFSLPPAQESTPGNDGDIPAVSKGAGITLILHPQHGFSIRSLSVHRGIIICVMGYKFLIILIISAYSKQVSWSAQCQAAYNRDTF